MSRKIDFDPDKPYRILFDWGSEGHLFDDGKFSTAKEAIEHALSLGYSVKFRVVKIVDWEVCVKVKTND